MLTADNGEEALQMVARRRPDVLVLDLSIPGMSGLELIQVLRQHSAIPIIGLSIRNGQRDNWLYSLSSSTFLSFS